jgi:predicted transcriptional regulator
MIERTAFYKYLIYIVLFDNKEYFSMLIENALIEYEGGRLNMYRTTEKGLRLLKIYNQIEEIIPQINNN